MDKFKEPFGARPDDLPDARGANITTGLPESCGCEVNASDMERGFKRLPITNTLPEPFGMMEGGFAGRPRGWER